MVRVPGSSGDAGFHRESHEDEKTTVKIDEGTIKTLEPGSPVMKKEEGGRAGRARGGALPLRSRLNMKKNQKFLPLMSSLKKTTWAIIIIMVQGPQV